MSAPRTYTATCRKGYSVSCSTGQLLPAPSTEVVIELSVRPLLESGVVMVLTEPVSAQLVLAVGLVRGVVSCGIAGVCA